MGYRGPGQNGNRLETVEQTGYFGIARWKAWAPGIRDDRSWLGWLEGDDSPEPDAQPDVGYLPPLLRRRLDRHGRMAMHTAWPCAEGRDTVRFVFGSRHGALERTVELLTALARSEGLSPTLFSLSVHNSAAGLFSIARGDRGAATSLAAGPDTLGLALLEGANMVADGSGPVLVCYSDDSLAPPYRRHTDDDDRPFSVSLLLTDVGEATVRCRLVREDAAPAEAPAHALMRFLLDGTPRSVLGVDQAWRIEREAAHAG